MYQKVIQELIFNKKRDIHLVTPCCDKQNKDGKFINYKGYSAIYGYCHSCGTSTIPPSLYLDEKGKYYHWNTVIQKFESVLQNPLLDVTQSEKDCNTLYDNNLPNLLKTKKFIDYKVVAKTINVYQENNLLQYLRTRYDDDKVNFVKQLYFLGTSKKSGTVFWFINKQGKTQKAKVSYYTENGKRTNRFEVPYKNADGYYNCLYGEHLLNNNTKPIILVESEKTAIVASIEFREYTWLAYSRINGLTDAKLRILKNEKNILIPDISQNAVGIMTKKLQKFRSLNIDAVVYDILGKSDTELKDCDWYNCDVEDVLRRESQE